MIFLLVSGEVWCYPAAEDVLQLMMMLMLSSPVLVLHRSISISSSNKKLIFRLDFFELQFISSLVQGSPFKRV